MSRTIRFTVSDSLYACAAEKAREQGRDAGNNSGVGSLAKGALRAYLNKNGYTVSELDGIDSDPFPAGRKAIDQEVYQ